MLLVHLGLYNKCSLGLLGEGVLEKLNPLAINIPVTYLETVFMPSVKYAVCYVLSVLQW